MYVLMAEYMSDLSLVFVVKSALLLSKLLCLQGRSRSCLYLYTAEYVSDLSLLIVVETRRAILFLNINQEYTYFLHVRILFEKYRI